jgi:hypothetical protein
MSTMKLEIQACTQVSIQPQTMGYSLPHALQMLLPTSSRRHSGVVLVPQLKHTIAPTLDLAAAFWAAVRAMTRAVAQSERGLLSNGSMLTLTRRRRRRLGLDQTLGRAGLGVVRLRTMLAWPDR